MARTTSLAYVDGKVDASALVAKLQQGKAQVNKMVDAMTKAHEQMAAEVQQAVVDELKAQERTAPGRVAARHGYLEDDILDQRNAAGLGGTGDVSGLSGGDWVSGFAVGLVGFLSYSAKSKKYWRAIESGTRDYPTAIHGFTDDPFRRAGPYGYIAPDPAQDGADAYMPQWRQGFAGSGKGKSPFRGDPSQAPHWVLVHASNYHYAPYAKGVARWKASGRADAIYFEVISKYPMLMAALRRA